MSTEESQPAQVDDQQDQPQGETETTEVQSDKPKGTDWKSMSRKHEARAKESSAELKKMRDAMNQMLSPDEVADKDAALADARKATEAAEIQATRFRVALAEGLPLELAMRLQGTTEDEMRDDAEQLKGLLKPSTSAKTDAKKGTNPPVDQTPPNANDLLRQIVAGKR
jgi:hypothetical protein